MLESEQSQMTICLCADLCCPGATSPVHMILKVKSARGGRASLLIKQRGGTSANVYNPME